MPPQRTFADFAAAFRAATAHDPYDYQVRLATGSPSAASSATAPNATSVSERSEQAALLSVTPPSSAGVGVAQRSQPHSPPPPPPPATLASSLSPLVSAKPPL
jgi:hypothetical protein